MSNRYITALININNNSNSISELVFCLFCCCVCSAEKGAERVKLLKHFIDKGNTTTYEWKHSRPPAHLEEPLRDYGIDDDQNGGNDEKGDEVCVCVCVRVCVHV